MASFISDIVKSGGMPIFDNVEFAKGCEIFLFRAKTGQDCWKLYYDFLNTVPESKQVKAYRIGMRPDYPIPVARYFIEVSVSDPVAYPIICAWTCVDNGRLED